ncbi:MAG: hypothetical protein H3C36_05655 [Chitinophagaceae bacterium]|nr:hypothetical protein [Chitinophagaceae bacterium]MCW5914282.1 hypothetical protein [Chitinophagaceae bacterium]MCZ2395537.1 hypothetical protein [Chitinophagales bacterium]
MKPEERQRMILSYSDFVKVRDYLAYYQLNPVVLHRLVQLTKAIRSVCYSHLDQVQKLSLSKKY